MLPSIAREGGKPLRYSPGRRCGLRNSLQTKAIRFWLDFYAVFHLWRKRRRLSWFAFGAVCNLAESCAKRDAKVTVAQALNVTGVDATREQLTVDTRLNSYSSMTTATFHPGGSSEHRTTRPWQFTSTGLSVPKSSFGISILNRATELTRIAASV